MHARAHTRTHRGFHSICPYSMHLLFLHTSVYSNNLLCVHLYDMFYMMSSICLKLLMTFACFRLLITTFSLLALAEVGLHTLSFIVLPAVFYMHHPTDYIPDQNKVYCLVLFRSSLER